MMCYEDEKYEKEEEENKQKSKTPDDEERKIGPGMVRNTEEPQVIPHSQSCIREGSTTGITSVGPELGLSMERIHKAWARREKLKCD